MKKSKYYFYVKTKLSVNFQVCISVPLRKFDWLNFDEGDIWLCNNGDYRCIRYQKLFLRITKRYPVLWVFNSFNYFHGQLVANEKVTLGGNQLSCSHDHNLDIPSLLLCAFSSFIPTPASSWEFLKLYINLSSPSTPNLPIAKSYFFLLIHKNLL